MSLSLAAPRPIQSNDKQRHTLFCVEPFELLSHTQPMRQTTRPHLTPRLRCTQRTHEPHPPLIRHDIRVQPDLLPHSSPCRGRLARESSTASHQLRAPRTECRAVPQHLNPTGLVQVSLGCPFGHNAEQSCATTSTMGSRATRRDHIRIRVHVRTSTMGSRATGTRRDHIQIRVHVRVRPPCSSLQRRPPRRSCSSPP